MKLFKRQCIRKSSVRRSSQCRYKKECMLIEYMITKLNSEWWVDVTCIDHVADFGL